jgi:two-component system, cell cycle response regulator
VEHSNNRGKALAVVALDVDFFKAINDTYGHDAGDKVLQELSQRIRANTRSIDLCCRVGGEEFILILPGTDLQLAEKIAERLRKGVAGKSFSIGTNAPIPVTLSAGVSYLAGIEDTVEKLLKRADQALYNAKREGRNRVISAAA